MKRALLIPAMLTLIALGIFWAGCGHSSHPAFNDEAVFFQAVLVPAGNTVMAADSQALSAALADLNEPGEDWAQAVKTVRESILNDKGSLKVSVVSSKEMEIPNVQYLMKFGSGFTQDDLTRCASSRQVYQLVFTCSAENVPELLPAFQALTLAAARKMHGYVYDINAKIVMTPAIYDKFLFRPRLSPINRYVVVQRYPYEPGHFRAATLGMATFGCPDLEIRDFPADSSLVIQELVYTVARHLIDQRLKSTRPPAFPDRLSLNPKEIGSILHLPLLPTGSQPEVKQPVAIRLVAGRFEPGDPQDNMVRILPGGDQPGGMEKWAAVLSQEVAGFSEKVEYLEGKAISQDILQKVRETLPEFKQKFLAADQPTGDYFVKFAYRVENTGSEFLWLKVTGWKDDLITGTLVSEPVMATDLSAGAPLKIKAQSVVDWMYRDPQGRVEGNFTHSITAK